MQTDAELKKEKIGILFVLVGVMGGGRGVVWSHGGGPGQNLHVMSTIFCFALLRHGPYLSNSPRANNVLCPPA
jgi:hypothetical protein